MSKKSIFYKYPLLYIWGLKWIHKDNFSKRYRYMASFAKKGDLVLEPACGPAILADFLPKGCLYRGFDTNKDFIGHAFKKHSGVYLGNVLDTKNYCQTEVVIACDILHHLKPTNRKSFIKNCFSSAKRVFIICEPARDDGGAYSKFWFEFIEKDGSNSPKFVDFWAKKELEFQMEDGFGVIPKRIPRIIKEIGKDFIAIYEK